VLVYAVLWLIFSRAFGWSASRPGDIRHDAVYQRTNRRDNLALHAKLDEPSARRPCGAVELAQLDERD